MSDTTKTLADAIAHLSAELAELQSSIAARQQLIDTIRMEGGFDQYVATTDILKVEVAARAEILAQLADVVAPQNGEDNAGADADEEATSAPAPAPRPSVLGGR